MGLMIVLDAGPLSLATQRRGVADAEACRQWIAEGIRRGWAFTVPAIAYYEVCRELERIRNDAGLARLDAFCQAVADRYLPFSDQALRLACRLWAQARNAGTPTADPKELDCDVPIAAQTLTIGFPVADLVIATTNVGHLAQFVKADLWTNIRP